MKAEHEIARARLRLLVVLDQMTAFLLSFVVRCTAPL